MNMKRLPERGAQDKFSRWIEKCGKLLGRGVHECMEMVTDPAWKALYQAKKSPEEAVEMYHKHSPVPPPPPDRRSKRLIAAMNMGVRVETQDGHRWIIIGEHHEGSCLLHAVMSKGLTFDDITKVYGSVDDALDRVDRLLERAEMSSLEKMFDEHEEWDAWGLWDGERDTVERHDKYIGTLSEEPCGYCQGLGKISEECPGCDGHGYHAKVQQDTIHTPCGWLPLNLFQGIRNYVFYHRKPDGFLQAVLCNDLEQTVSRADWLSQHALTVLVKFLLAHIPNVSWMNKAHVAEWVKKKSGHGSKFMELPKTHEHLNERDEDVDQTADANSETPAT